MPLLLGTTVGDLAAEVTEVGDPAAGRVVEAGDPAEVRVAGRAVAITPFADTEVTRAAEAGAQAGAVT